MRHQRRRKHKTISLCNIFTWERTLFTTWPLWSGEYNVKSRMFGFCGEREYREQIAPLLVHLCSYRGCSSCHWNIFTQFNSKNAWVIRKQERIHFQQPPPKPGGYLSQFLLGMYRWPLRPLLHYSLFLWPSIDPILVTFGQVVNVQVVISKTEFNVSRLLNIKTTAGTIS